MSFTVGSLFDGSGGFPLAATMCGGTPIWAAEVEPYPIAVTTSRFPNMKHLGSVTDVKGDKVEPVDVLCFGAPCQDLSVAGLRKGLRHDSLGDGETTRSGLFMEAVRIIKEMKEATNGVYPRFAIYENVPGAFSSSGGEDWRTVLEELIKIVEPTAVMPEVPKNGWPYADSYCGDGWSIAYRVLDAQFWGVPQRRRRIYLVLDLRGECAGKVSFEREGLRGYFETGRTPWQAAPRDAESGSGTTNCEANCVAYSLDPVSSNSMKSSNPHSGFRQVEVARCLDTTDPNPCKNQGGIAVVEAIGFDGYNSTETGDKAATLGVNCGMSTGRNGVVEGVPYTLKIRSGCEGGGKGALIQTDMSATLSTLNDQYLFQPVILDDQGGSQISVRDDGKCPTLRAEMHGNVPCVLKEQHLFENHSQDSRYKGPLEVCPMLPAQLGTGGNNQPFVVEHTVYESHPMDSRIKELDGVCPTVSAKWHKGAADTPLVCDCIPIHDQATRFAGKHGKKSDGKGNGLGVGNPGGGFSLNCNQVVRIQYIVRRLTPTECARLQGFPDKWGHPIEKTEFTDEEYQFWLNVRNTHAAINDKPTKDYTKDQILKWYNSLHTDSSEYKMWGNGIALPNALYMMQGIAEVMSEEKAARRKWLSDLLGGCL